MVVTLRVATYTIYIPSALALQKGRLPPHSATQPSMLRSGQIRSGRARTSCQTSVPVPESRLVDQPTIRHARICNVYISLSNCHLIIPIRFQLIKTVKLACAL
jgi:hypothetical protein